MRHSEIWLKRQSWRRKFLDGRTNILKSTWWPYNNWWLCKNFHLLPELLHLRPQRYLSTIGSSSSFSILKDCMKSEISINSSKTSLVLLQNIMLMFLLPYLKTNPVEDISPIFQFQPSNLTEMSPNPSLSKDGDKNQLISRYRPWWLNHKFSISMDFLAELTNWEFSSVSDHTHL